jgi:hypothetical protein
MEEHGFQSEQIFQDCFFCEWSGGACDKCPGKRIEPGFNCETEWREPRWYMEPKEFNKRIQRMYRKRLRLRKEKETREGNKDE